MSKSSILHSTPADSTVIKQWQVRFPALSKKGHSKRPPIGRRLILCIESHCLPVTISTSSLNTNNNDVDARYKIVITIRKLDRCAPWERQNFDANIPPNDSLDGDSNTKLETSIDKELSDKIKKLTTKCTLDLFDLETDGDSQRSAFTTGLRLLSGQSFHLLSTENKTCHVTINYKEKKQKRLIVFATKCDYREFCAEITKYKEASLDYQRKRFKKLTLRDEFKDLATQNGIRHDFGTFSKITTTFLIEIVGAEDLSSEPTKCNPYVEVRLLDKVVHKTEVIPNEADPIWTLKTKSYFILNINARELLKCVDGIHFIVYDNTGGCDKILGAVCVPFSSLCTMHESRTEYKLKPYVMEGKAEGQQQSGSISIKCRIATDNDKDFMESYELKSKNGYITETNTDSVMKGASTWQSISKIRKREYMIKDKKLIKRLIRPYPDPARLKSTAWMSEGCIETETMKPSSTWVHTGSGKLARIYLEVLQCNSLPNKDRGKAIEKNKTDTFVQVVYEDCTKKTDVISDCLSPRWLPWTRRAFVLQMEHPSSQIHLGVIDYDEFSRHDFIGKVAVDVTYLRANHQYVLDYDIFDTLMNTAQTKAGKIKIRVRIEVDDHQALVLASLSRPTVRYINTPKKKHFDVVSDTVKGVDDLNECKIEHTITLLKEIYTYLDCKQYIIEAFTFLIMWRCAYDLEIPLPSFLRKYHTESLEQDIVSQRFSKVTIPLPLDSIVVFICSVTLVENIALLPSYIFVFCGWSLISVLNWRQTHPDPWCQTFGFLDTLRCLVIGSENCRKHNIACDENIESIKNFNDMWENRLELARKRAVELVERRQKQLNEVALEMEEFGSTFDLSTKKKSAHFISPKYHVEQLLKATIYPYQQVLLNIVQWLRLFRNVVIWQEYYFSFYAVVACFTIAAIFLFIPWVFIMRWVSRIVVWSLFGPWIKIGITIYNKLNFQKFCKKKLEQSKNTIVKQVRIRHEESSKYRSFKQYLFGKYMVKVPTLKTDRVIQRPLSSSTATYIDMNESFTSGVRKHLYYDIHTFLLLQTGFNVDI